MSRNTAIADYIMEDPREATRLEQKVARTLGAHTWRIGSAGSRSSFRWLRPGSYFCGKFAHWTVQFEQPEWTFSAELVQEARQKNRGFRNGLRSRDAQAWSSHRIVSICVFRMLLEYLKDKEGQ